jgi:hemolysin III
MIKEEIPEWFNQRLPDGGPIYAETNLDQFIVEPWNAFSSLLIIIPALYWFYRITGSFSHYRFMLYSIILVILGGLGSALFHAFRVSPVFLVMDIAPSALLTLSISIYLWLKIFKKWWYVLLVIVPAFLFRFLLFSLGNLPQHVAINVSYFTTGVIVALPLLIILFKTKFQHILAVLGAIIPFMLALLFRQLDAKEISFLPMGTHFLWHLFSAIGAYFVLKYLYILRDIDMKGNKKKEANLGSTVLPGV